MSEQEKIPKRTGYTACFLPFLACLTQISARVVGNDVIKALSHHQERTLRHKQVSYDVNLRLALPLLLLPDTNFLFFGILVASNHLFVES